MKYKKTTVPVLILAAALVVGATTVFAASGKPGSAPDGAGFLGAGTLADDSTLTSYTDPKDGKNYYSWDGGKTWEPLTDEELRQRSPLADVEWWTYEEYAAWLENERVELQAMLGEKGWTGGRGEFVWTQEIIDETIAMYEGILQEIGEGKLYSKSVGGDADCLLISGGAVGFAREKEDGVSVSSGEAEDAVPADLAITCGMAVGKDEVDAVGCDVPAGNAVSFRTHEELEAHLRALEANEEKGLNRYAGFEALYAGVDTSAPILYIVG